jgi:hypothetical protein
MGVDETIGALDPGDAAVLYVAVPVAINSGAIVLTPMCSPLTNTWGTIDLPATARSVTSL